MFYSFDDRERRGQCVLLCEDSHGRYFVEQYNAADFEAFQQFEKNRQALPFHCILRQETVIHYCPSCGKNLDDWIVENPDETKRAIELSKPYIIESPDGIRANQRS